MTEQAFEKRMVIGLTCFMLLLIGCGLMNNDKPSLAQQVKEFNAIAGIKSSALSNPYNRFK